MFGDLKRSFDVLSHDTGVRDIKGAFLYAMLLAMLPEEVVGKQTTFRKITCDGEQIEFSGGFTDLHTVSYENILAGRGYGLEDARHCVEAVANIRASAPVSAQESRAHPCLPSIARSIGLDNGNA